VVYYFQSHFTLVGQSLIFALVLRCSLEEVQEEDEKQEQDLGQHQKSPAKVNPSGRKYTERNIERLEK
jgi:hypothetical protein